MKVSVYSLKNTLFDAEAESATFDTTTGQITVLDNHEPLITVLKEGLIKIIGKDKKENYIQVKDGFLEVRSQGSVRAIIEENKKS
jgi:F-type H+-transporting ATPase subunit epsilon